MPWLDAYSDDNKIIDAEDKDVYSVFVPAFLVTYKRVTTTLRYRHVGMTYDAAVDCRDALHAPDADPAVYASIRRENDSGAYTVDVSVVSDEPWETES